MSGSRLARDSGILPDRRLWPTERQPGRVATLPRCQLCTPQPDGSTVLPDTPTDGSTLENAPSDDGRAWSDDHFRVPGQWEPHCAPQPAG